MAEEIIDLRERIEKMRIEIDKESLLQKVNNKPIEVHHQMFSQQQRDPHPT